jgi:hypothetical protein
VDRPDQLFLLKGLVRRRWIAPTNYFFAKGVAPLESGIIPTNSIKLMWGLFLRPHFCLRSAND